jgi:glutathione S-transferase
MSVHLVRDGGEQNKQEFKTINPMGQVPAFILNDVTITQSMAIMEFLEESFSDRQCLLPKDPFQRAKVKFLIHYQIKMNALKYYSTTVKHDKIFVFNFWVS